MDYKTGYTPTNISIENGETVQLPFYAMLLNDSIQVEYLDLNTQNSVSSKCVLSTTKLDELKTLHSERLKTLVHAIAHGKTLPAQGVEETCRICDYNGLCRKSHWIPEEIAEKED